MVSKRGPTTDALEVLHRRFYEGRPERLAALERARLSLEIGVQIYELRTRAKLSQRQLAKLVGTTASVICRLEDADYSGHSLPMLHRIATALASRIELRFVPVGKTRPQKPRRKQAVA